MMNKTTSPEDMQQFMEENLVKLATEKPWSWAWKFLVAQDMLTLGKDIKYVKDLVGVTYPWLIRRGLIKYNKLGQLIKA